jgi:hypothetical protein
MGVCGTGGMSEIETVKNVGSVAVRWVTLGIKVFSFRWKLGNLRCHWLPGSHGNGNLRKSNRRLLKLTPADELMMLVDVNIFHQFNMGPNMAD